MPLISKLVALIFGINLLLAAPKPMQSYSQASQDRFVYLLLYELLGKQDEGYYLEIGSGHPTNINNTYFLEKNLSWKGVSIDIDEVLKEVWSSARQNPLLIEDATLSDYHSILQPFPRVIDYLSLDIDSSYDIVLKKIFLSDHIFKIITIEHDFYKYGDKYRESERKILSSLGYYLLCPDISLSHNGKEVVFEDWWINPSAFPADVLSKLTSLDLKAKNHSQLISSIENLLHK